MRRSRPKRGYNAFLSMSRQPIKVIMFELGLKSEKKEHKHLSDKDLKQITADHLRSDPRYYDNLLPSKFQHSD